MKNSLVWKKTGFPVRLLKDGMLNYPKTPIIAYLNLTILSNKMTDLRILLQDFHFDCFVLDKTKPDSSSPAEQFHIPGFEIRAPRDQNKWGRGLAEYVKKGVTWKRNQKFDTLTHESVCSELTIAKKKWLCFSRWYMKT